MATIVNDALFVKVHPDAIIPSYQSEQAACCDISTIEDVELPCGSNLLFSGLLKPVLVRTGLIAIPPSGYHWQVYLRSSAPLKFPGLLLANSVGIIDSDYCGPEDELKLILVNMSDRYLNIPKHTRIAQMKLVDNIRPIALVEVSYEKAFNQDMPSRGGFGSTDEK